MTQGLKIIRTICLFTQQPTLTDLQQLNVLNNRFESHGYTVQTQRLCAPNPEAIFELDAESDGSVYLSMGSISFEKAESILPQFLAAKNVAFNVDMADFELRPVHVRLLLDVFKKNPEKTFSLAYTFNNVPSSPFFPSAAYDQDGIAIGLQPTDLSAGCATIDEWLAAMQAAWEEIAGLMENEPNYLGIDTSIAPLYEGPSSFLNIIRRTSTNLDEAVLSDRFLKISRFIKERGPKKTGLCGLFFPCLEDFELAEEYERGGFSMERNIFLSLHSGLGIDTYPVGMDEDPARILDIMKLVQGLSNKYQKPLSIRFISDGSAKIGQKADFKNEFLKDVVIRRL